VIFTNKLQKKITLESEKILAQTHNKNDNYFLTNVLGKTQLGKTSAADEGFIIMQQ